MAFLQPVWMYPAIAAACSMAGSVFDVKSRRIPNYITFPSILAGLAMHLALGGWRQLLSSLAAGLICGLALLAFYIAGGMGAGDVKLMTAVGCIAGLPYVAYLLILTAICGGAMAILLALFRGSLRQTIWNVGSIAAHHAQQGFEAHPELNLSNPNTLRLPYALAIAGGSLLTLCIQ
ncbi:MAG TPA: A24 family peptidase [Acidobacteriaceae bacterium]|nr:A24 family peptidase [Acidobacteriaceae bacterium]